MVAGTAIDVAVPAALVMVAPSAKLVVPDGASHTVWRLNAENHYHLVGGSYYRAKKRLIDLGYVSGSKRPKRYSLTGMGLSASLPTTNPLP